MEKFYVKVLPIAAIILFVFISGVFVIFGFLVKSDKAGSTSTTAQTNTSTSSSTNTDSTQKVFTRAELAQHNSSGDCYIAYNGTVYDLSSESQWRGCRHHGATGGKDITYMFPHPVSYFDSEPVVGTLE